MPSIERSGWLAILTTTNSAMRTSPAGIAAARQLDDISSVGVMTMASTLTCSIAAGSSMHDERERHRERERLGERAQPSRAAG